VLTTIRSAWKTPELRKKILFTLFILLLFRVGTVVGVPYINASLLTSYFDTQLSNTILGLYNAMSGSAFSQASVFALGIQPYINASIIVELLCIALPFMEKWRKDEGEEGRKKIEKCTRFGTIAIALIMGIAYYTMMVNQTKQGFPIITDTGFFPAVVIVATFMAGACLVMWLGERINENGIGNGISMILFAGIVSRLPQMIAGTFSLKWYLAILMVVGTLALVIFIIFINASERRIPVQYAKRVVGRKVYGGQSSHLPIKVNMSGVMPIIFAQSIASLPATICAFIGKTGGWWYRNVFDSTSIIYTIFYFFLIIGFSYFYAAVQYNPVEISNNMKNNGGFIPGFRPGRPTADFIAKVINKITLFGALFLAVVALMPVLLGVIVGNNTLAIGGTSIIIVVGVALETVNALEAQLLMRHYKGFLD